MKETKQDNAKYILFVLVGLSLLLIVAWAGFKEGKRQGVEYCDSRVASAFAASSDANETAVIFPNDMTICTPAPWKNSGYNCLNASGINLTLVLKVYKT